jgi:predicted acetylornithine/succinylornithine family transaminase
MSNNFLEDYKKLFIPSYDPVDFLPYKAHGSILYDSDGNDVIDFAGGVAASALGQTNEQLIKALYEQSKTLWHVGNIFTNHQQLNLAKKLTTLTCFDKIFIANSGSEVVETSLKLARRYAHKNYSSVKSEIIAFNRSFHGRTLLAVATGGQAKYWEGFNPLPDGIKHAPYNQIEGLEEFFNENTAAVIVEPIEAEGGVIVANLEFLQKLRQLCDKYNALLIFDEVQTGIGRTGYLFAYQMYGIEPDMITIAKALANGFPIGVLLAKDPYTSGFDIGSHGATFGGNPLACAVANQVLDIINNQDFLLNIKLKHQLFVNQLYKINAQLNIYSEIRGCGLLIGAEFSDQYKGHAYKLVKIAIKHGVSVLNASPDVTRFVPALNISDDLIIEGINRLANALIEFKNTILNFK